MHNDTDLHGVFAYTIYGDKVRVSHYSNWDDAQREWDLVDKMLTWYPLIKWLCVRSWDDPAWNTARYRSLETIGNQEVL